jgi:hypothetical protein
MIVPNKHSNMIYLITMLFMTCSMNSFCSDSTKVNVALEKYRKMLPQSFKIDSIYEVKIVEEIDLNGDNILDKVITWKRKTFTEGDTIKTTIYFAKDGSHVFINTYKNLYTLDFRYWTSQSTGDKVLDDLKDSYVNSNYSMVEFETNKITIGLYTSSLDGCDYHFIYNPKKRNWFLEHIQCWDGWNYLARKLGDIQPVTEKIPIEKFDIPKILGF